MIYTNVLSGGGRGVESPADRLPVGSTSGALARKIEQRSTPKRGVNNGRRSA
jgi:hypothetical protein